MTCCVEAGVGCSVWVCGVSCFTGHDERTSLQVEEVAAKKEQLRETVDGLQEAAAAARAPPVSADDSMLLAEDAVKTEEVERGLYVHEVSMAAAAALCKRAGGVRRATCARAGRQ